MPVVDFYGSDDPATFAIERRAMDRPGLVLAALDRRLPAAGTVVDVGAGDGFTAERLTTATRRIVALEPSAEMVRRDRPLPWVGGEAEALPFADGSMDAAYATWAYFLTAPWDIEPGVAELHRVVRAGGPLLVVDNLGCDEFTSMTDRTIVADVAAWDGRGFGCEAVATRFEFDDLDEARHLLGFFFGDRGRRGAKLSVGFRVGVFHAASRGPAGGPPAGAN